MGNFIIFVALMSALVVGIAILSIAFAVVISTALSAFRRNT